MVSPATPSAGPAGPAEPLGPVDRLDVLFAELSELTGQRNAIDGRIVEVIAEIDRDGLCGMTGARSVPAMVAWKTGVAPRNAETLVAVARRAHQFPRCTDALRRGALSLDQVGVIAERAAEGSDEHYAHLAASATVTQLRTAIKLAPHPDPPPSPAPLRSLHRTVGAQATTYRITLPHLEAAVLDAAVASHLDALIGHWRRDHPTTSGGGGGAGEAGAGGGAGRVGGVGAGGGAGGAGGPGRPAGAGAGPPGCPDQPDAGVPPFPTLVDGFLGLVQAGWDTDVAARPHGQRTTVVVHLDLDTRISELHLGPMLSDADRRYLTCDATCEAWFHHAGRVIGAGRATRTIGRRLRRVLEHRDTCCRVPGCGATRGLHAHHLQHWEDGGPTEVDNLVLICPHHHRAHHHGHLTLTGPADHLTVTDADGRPLDPGSLARPPSTPPPQVPPYRGPTGEHADWWWYQPYEPPPPEN